MDWTEISPQAAALEEDYGIQGWLLAIYIIVVLAFFGGLIPQLDTAGMAAEYKEHYFSALLGNMLQMLMLLPFLILTLLKDRRMPVVSIAAIWISVLAGAYVSALPISEAPLALAEQYFFVLVDIVICTLFSWYLLRSRRVNVTFRHRIPSDQTGTT